MFNPQGKKSFIDDRRHSLAQRTAIFIPNRPTSLALAERVVLLNRGRMAPPAAQPSSRPAAGALP